MDFLFNSIWGWLGIGGTVIAVALAVAWFIPPFRKLALTVAAFAAGVLAVYAKGASDAKRRERERSEAAVRKINKKYGEIDARPDDDSTVDRKLRGGKF
jgi:hypothetical protein